MTKRQREQLTAKNKRIYLKHSWNGHYNHMYSNYARLFTCSSPPVFVFAVVAVPLLR